MKKFLRLSLIPLLLTAFNGFSQVIPVGSGSYTNTFYGSVTDGHSYPSGVPQISGNAVGKPVPTSDWWSALIKNGQASNLFNYPFTMKTTNNGLVVTYNIPFGVIDETVPFSVGVSGMAAAKTTVSDYSDWTVTMDWNDGTHNFKATSGVGMPFLYFTKKTSDVVQVTVATGTVVVSNEMLVITNVKNDADFAVYAPAGSTWIKSGNVYTSTLNGKNYWSMAFIPLSASNVTTVANEYKKYAYVFPVNTTATYTYNENTSVLHTNFNVKTEVKEGADTNMILGLLPHQWAHLALPLTYKYSYPTVRGEMKTIAGNSFSVENTFHGILPTLPYIDNYSNGFSPSELTQKITDIENEVFFAQTNTYDDGQMMNKLVQTARIADEMGNTASRDKLLNTLKNRLANWFKAENGDLSFLFYYNSAWSAMLGYPAGYGQDFNLNDRHFHWGYFIHAAAFMEQYEPGWAAQWGGMVNLLVRDAASPYRNDTMFPYLRNFSPYQGHSFADGFANDPRGNNQESSSESMVFASSLIHWGEVTGDKTIRDLGIYLYTTEQTGIEEYYLDTQHRNFPATQPYSLVSRVWTNSIDNGTFWTSDLAASYGIELYPIHGGSFYLGQDTVYARKLWDEMAANTGIMINQVNPELWHDIYWQYLAFIDPAKAIEMYNSYPDRNIKFGVSDAQTYHWLHAMNALGRIDAGITADYPIAAAFILNGVVNYVAQNYSDSPITVTFSTGYKLDVPARKMVTSMDGKIAGVLTSSFPQAAAGGSVTLTVVASGGTPAKVEFMDGDISLGSDATNPFTLKAADLQAGIHTFYAKVYDGDKFYVTNNVNVQVGNQLPYGGTAMAIPGTIEAGKYDTYEGGNGQNVSYYDVTTANSGGFRSDEYVDAAAIGAEGAIAGTIAAGEWLEYTVNVELGGLYSFAFRYSSGNPAGGGPFSLQLDGVTISNVISVPTTNSWNVWATKTVTDIPLTPGRHILRVAFPAGEFNLGKMTFTRTGDLANSYPTALAGGKLILVLPETSATLDGSASTESAGKPLTYAWTQNYGSTQAQFSDATSDKPVISGLEEGIYSVTLTVTNTDMHTDEDELLIAVSSTASVLPVVSLVSPAANSTFTVGNTVTLSANASDFGRSIQKVDFYQNDIFISSDNLVPYSATWNPAAGNYVLAAKATNAIGDVGISQAVNVTIASKMTCTETSNISAEGSFSLGYKSTYKTEGTSVTITFELLDTDKTGVTAYLLKETPFAEAKMFNVSGKIFTTTLTGQTVGSVISYACKFVYSGGQVVTRYISYQVGDNCVISDDTEKPANFTATVGATTSGSIELLLQASDNSGYVVYTINYGSVSQRISATAGAEKSLVITGLMPSSSYSFQVSASDFTGNTALNNPITLNASTTAKVNTQCSGLSTDASQGSFSTGYLYDFSTSGTTVTVTFQLLDNRVGVVAYLWREPPYFSETPMTNVSGKVFSATLSNQTVGATLSYACKFAYEGGLSVTKYLSYVVGNNCIITGLETSQETKQMVYPNPVKDMLHLKLLDEQSQIILTDMLGNTLLYDQVPSSHILNMSDLKPGNYFLRVENKYGVQFMKVIKN